MHCFFYFSLSYGMPEGRFHQEIIFNWGATNSASCNHSSINRTGVCFTQEPEAEENSLEQRIESNRVGKTIGWKRFQFTDYMVGDFSRVARKREQERNLFFF